jgi:HK97 family phage prohead protease
MDRDQLHLRRQLHGTSRPGAFAHSLAQDRNRLRVLFQHGRDPQIGDKVLGIPTLLREDELGAQYEVPLLDTSYVADLIPGLRAGAYGASFRFKVLREDLNESARASRYNPKGLPERTIREAKVMEFGPVTFPATKAQRLASDRPPISSYPPGRSMTGPRKTQGDTPLMVFLSPMGFRPRS